MNIPTSFQSRESNDEFPTVYAFDFDIDKSAMREDKRRSVYWRHNTQRWLVMIRRSLNDGLP